MMMWIICYRIVLINNRTACIFEEGFPVKTAIAPTVDAATAVIALSIHGVIPLLATGLAGEEAVVVEVPTPAGGWTPYVSGGATVELSASDNKILLDVPGNYRLNKTATLAAVGVMLDVD